MKFDEIEKKSVLSPFCINIPSFNSKKLFIVLKNFIQIFTSTNDNLKDSFIEYYNW